MSKGKNQKLKLYYLSRILIEKTDEEHSLTLREIQNELLEYGVTADRKSLYDDVEALNVLGIDIVKEREGSSFGYRVVGKQFEIAELKLLVDAIQSSKFITKKKSNELIKKLTGCASQYEADQLRRQVVVAGRIKSMNESIYYNVDEIHEAIATNRMIRFEYLQWNLQKKLVPRRKEPYEISPWALCWDNENYYLVGYDSAADSIKHYRVDKMRSISVIEKKREGGKRFKAFDMAAYATKNFGMFGGEEQTVKLEFDNDMVGVILDRFGTDVTIRPAGEGRSTVNVDVYVSDPFFGWIFGLGGKVKIVGSKEIVMEWNKAIQSFGESK